MRRNRVFIIVLCAVIGTILLICALFAILRAVFPAVFYRVYPFARITGTVTVTVDGKPYSLHPHSISALEDSHRDTPHSSIKPDGSARVRIHAGRYGMYGFCLTIDDVAQPIRITAYQFDWWNVTRFDLTVSVDTVSNSVTFYTETQEIDDDGAPCIYERTDTVPLSDPDIGFSIVNG